MAERRAPGLAFLIRAALIVHGVFGVWQVVVGGGGRADRRVSGALTALASITVGAVAFGWPVLTLVVFRFGVAAWFIFAGLHLLFTALLTARSSHRRTRHSTRIRC
ncbi:hypothetical protein AB0I35_24055 [Nocardia sp. NPDC050378]|uniref:hypothetical protein n=1 Tax=Nocardia sp. NPDC050378 TaxID=3155400 RepID=UPI0033F6B4DA